MTDEQRKMIDKLNEDNRKLNDVNKGMKDYAKYKLVVGSIPTETTICQRLHLACARCFFYALFKAYSHIMVIFLIINKSKFILSFR